VEAVDVVTTLIESLGDVATTRFVQKTSVDPDLFLERRSRSTGNLEYLEMTESPNTLTNNPSMMYNDSIIPGLQGQESLMGDS
jgi:hypothetical protein